MTGSCGKLKLHVYGKRQTSDLSWKFLKIENEQIKQLKTILMDKKLRENTTLGVEIMNSNRQVEETWSRGTNSSLRFDVNADAKT